MASSQVATFPEGAKCLSLLAEVLLNCEDDKIDEQTRTDQIFPTGEESQAD
jgi:hypothetical protein